MLDFSIPSTGFILLTAGLEVEANAARVSADVFSPLGIFRELEFVELMSDLS